MKTVQSLIFGAAGLLAVSCQQNAVPKMEFVSHGDTMAIQITSPTKYLLLPIQEDQPDVWVKLNTGNDEDDVWMDVRLARETVDYYVPFALTDGAEARVDVMHLPADAVAWNNFQLSDTFDTTNREYYRPLYHFTPAYGWMNDPNGMTYFNGEYHLFFQYNPYGSKWGNMHWGHAVSKDMIHWEQLDPAISRDKYGQIFSGSSYIARLPEGAEGTDPFEADVLVPGNGTEGDFIASYYTSENNNLPRELQEQQSFAISTDGGRTYRKFGEPRLATNGPRDFRDPKLFWNDLRGEWGMIVSADKEMQFYGSKNLRDWTYLSAFGDGYGVQPRQFECPDFFVLPVEPENPDAKMTREQKAKWVMIVNVNPGCWFGGSASQYFTGEFDGTTFKCDNQKETVKWLDWGKDHYAAVTFSCEPKGRIIAMPWMSNWQYANDLPTRQYRSQMGMARQLFAFQSGKEVYVGQRPVEEMQSILKPASVEVSADCVKLGNEDAPVCIDFDIKNGSAVTVSNDDEEFVYIACRGGRILMDRQKSGIIPTQDFACETWSPVPELGINSGTWAPVEQLCGKKDSYHVQLWLDRCSVEMFVEGGKATMTNLVFPKTPYNKISGEGMSNVQVRNISL
ncbi:MAG: DUF4980 domain-containing protein [Bacteroidales bacterium]|nr:DUF4980 domain-containing protein [Candidatus Liminaster caballi]